MAPARETILVTGAAGFIGGRVAELLHLAGDRRIRAGIRRWPTAARLGRFPVDICCLDIMDPQSLADALDGVSAVVHCAVGSSAVNSFGTRNLLEAARRHGIRRFVHMSSAEVYGEASGRIDEDHPFGYTGTDYNASKIDAERAVWEYAARGLPVTVLRPSIVYGPFSTDWSTKLAMAFLAGKGRTYEALGEGVCNPVFVDDLVSAILLCLANEAAVGNAFNVVGPEVVTWNEYFLRFNRAMGLPPLPAVAAAGARMKSTAMQPLRWVGGLVRDHFMGPARRVAAASPLAKSIMKSTERALKMTPPPAQLRLFGRKMLLSGEKLQRRVGFSPAWSLDEGLQATAEWLRRQGFCGIGEASRA